MRYANRTRQCDYYGLAGLEVGGMRVRACVNDGRKASRWNHEESRQLKERSRRIRGPGGQYEQKYEHSSEGRHTLQVLGKDGLFQLAFGLGPTAPHRIFVPPLSFAPL